MQRKKSELLRYFSPLAGLGLLVVGVACNSSKREPASDKASAAAPAPEATAKTAEPAPGATPGPEVGQAPAAQGPGGGEGGTGGPGSGAGRWKDTGVYLDGKPISFLSFGELPIGLKPTWKPVKVDAERRPGTQDPTWRWAKQRTYRFTDYLRALKVNPAKVKELHVWGPRAAEAIIVTGRDLTSAKAKDFTFRFASVLAGKALPHLPDDFGNNRRPDKISAIMIFVDKPPPVLVRNEGFELDGKPVEGIPYYGEPMRGGTRVYLDDRFVATIKRSDVDPAASKPGPGGQPSFGLYQTLAKQGVDTSKVVEGWIIRRQRRAEKLAAAELATVSFQLGDQARGLLLGDQQLVVEALALHTRAIRPEDLPEILPEEE